MKGRKEEWGAPFDLDELCAASPAAVVCGGPGDALGDHWQEAPRADPPPAHRAVHCSQWPARGRAPRAKLHLQLTYLIPVFVKSIPEVPFPLEHAKLGRMPVVVVSDHHSPLIE